MSAYHVDFREIEFSVFEQFHIEQVLADAGLSDCVDTDTYLSMLRLAQRFACERLGALYQSADREGCELLPDGRVRLPEGFHALWREYKEMGWGKVFLASPEQSGMPLLAALPMQEMLFGANTAFMVYTGFALPLAQLIQKHDRLGLLASYVARLIDSDWAAAVCLTEPDAGSEVGRIRTRAVRQPDGRYRLYGSKIFISAGAHDLASNLIYAVLARVDGAPAGTTGLTCFLVLRNRQDPAGGWTEPNGVRVVRLEDKMGLRGCATAELHFDGAEGFMLGERENAGLPQMFSLLTKARMSTGIMALGMASSAYLYALNYACQRVQGTAPLQAYDPNAPRLAIVEHSDVQRMLLEMKSKVEGSRALLLRAATHQSYTEEPLASAIGKAAAQRHAGLYRLLTPLVKAWISDQAWRVCELAIQTLGGHGFIRDHPLEQYARDVKILSLWEGTNYMQAADLVRDKLAMGRQSVLLRWFTEDVRACLDDMGKLPSLLGERELLAGALGALEDAVGMVGRWNRAGRVDLIFSHATRLLNFLSEVAIGWMLLEAAAIARRRLDAGGLGTDEVAFYQGKLASASYFLANHLADYPGRLAVMAATDRAESHSAAEVLVSANARKVPSSGSSSAQGRCTSWHAMRERRHLQWRGP